MAVSIQHYSVTTSRRAKGKVFPLQALGDPEVRAPDFLDFRHYKVGKVVTLTHPHAGSHTEKTLRHFFSAVLHKTF
jgi:hypothetical protein